MDTFSVGVGMDGRYSTHSLLFDGTDDVVTTAADATADTKSYSFWAKSSEAGPNGVFDHGSWQQGTLEFNDNAGRPQLYLGSGTLRYWTDNSAQDDNAWHHWVCYIEHDDITNCKLYCDGVLLGVNYTAESTYYAYSTGLRIGRGSLTYFNGSLDEFAVFDGELSGAQVLAIYNSGTPADLSVYSPEHWWRMGEDNSITGTTISDIASGGKDGTLVSAPVFASTGPVVDTTGSIALTADSGGPVVLDTFSAAVTAV